MRAWDLNDKSGGLFFGMPNNEEFKTSFASAPTPPYVFMQPVDDIPSGHRMMVEILKHRVSVILDSRYEGVSFPKLSLKLGSLRTDYVRLRKGLERWAWPETSDFSHFSKPPETRNQMVYVPASVHETGTPEYAVSAMYKSFKTNLDAVRAGFAAAANAVPKNRLGVFRSLPERPKAAAVLPRIKPVDAAKSSSAFPGLSHSEATWRELLLGEDGPWKKALEFHAETSERNAARASPPIAVHYSSGQAPLR